MNLKLLLTSWTCILCALSCKSELTELQQKEIGNYINSVCHIQDGCDESINNILEAEKLIGNTCCKGCPCKNCSMVNSQHFSEFIECLEPVPYGQNGSEKLLKYKFVTKEPKEGCVSNVQTETDVRLASCDTDVVTALGKNFYPVYSYDKNVNFKNENCALCHGARNLEHWKVYSVYNGNSQHDLEIITINFKNFNSSEIFTWFVGPDKESSNLNNLCFDIIDHCKPENKFIIDIPYSINMTIEQVKEACEHGPQFKYMVNRFSWFKNIFCALCNGAPIYRNDLKHCETFLFLDGPKTNNMALTYLLRRDFIYDEIEKNSNGEKKRILACSKDIGETDDVRCREVACPLLQTRLHDGNCDYPFDVLNIDKIVLVLNLSSSTTDQGDVFPNMTNDGIRRLFEKNTPWPRFWKIISIHKRLDVAQKLEFMVTIGLDTGGSIDVKKFNTFLSITLSKFWTIDASSNDSIIFRQAIHTHGTLTRDSFLNIKIRKPVWTARGGMLSSLSKAEQPSWIIIYSDNNKFHMSNRGEEIRLEKSFLCSQIFLKPNEYILEDISFPLFLNQEKKFIYPGEYFVYGDDKRDDTIAICLEDSRFLYLGNSKAANPHREGVWYNFHMICLTCLLLGI